LNGKVSKFKGAKLRGVEMLAYAKIREESGARTWGGTRRCLFVAAISNYTASELRP